MRTECNDSVTRHVLNAALLLLGIASLPTHATDLGIPSLTAVQRDIESITHELNDPELGLGRAFHEFSEAEIRGRKLLIPYSRVRLIAETALSDLLVGNVVEFNVRLNEFLARTADLDPDSFYWGLYAARALHLGQVWHGLQNSRDVFFDRELTEDRRFLRQVT